MKRKVLSFFIFLFISLNASAQCSTPITGGTRICGVGGTIQLNDATSLGTWSCSAGTGSGIIDASTGVLSGGSAGTVNITYSVGGCTYNYTVTVYNPPIISGTTSVPVGGVTSLGGTPTGGTWAVSPSSIATVDAAGNVYGVAPGTASLSYYDAHGCKSPASITVFGCSYPISGATTVCAGAAISLTNGDPAGGTWTSSATGTATVNASTGVVTGLSAGSVTITFTSAGGCVYTHVITVTDVPDPGVISGSTSVCAGAAISLSETVLSGTWSSGATSTATVDASGVVTGVATGTTTISYALSNSCGTSYATYDISVLDLPNVASITGSHVACLASVTTLSDATLAGTWSSSNSSIATVDVSGGVTGVAVGSFAISYAVTNSCGTVYATYSMSVIAAPSAISASASPNPLCSGTSLTLTGTVTGATGFSWSGPNGYSSAMQNPTPFTVNTLSAGVYTFTATNFCGSLVAYTSSVTVQVMPVGGTISGTTPVCRNVPTTLTTTGTPGGTWTSSNTTYATVGSATGVVTGANVGAGSPGPATVTITYSVTNTCGSASSTFNIKIKGIPYIGGGPWVCTGDPHTLTASPSSATYGSGYWVCSACSTVTTGIIPPNKGTITSTATGGIGIATYTYTYTNPSDANYCAGSVSISIGAVAFPTLTVTGNNSLSTTGGGSCAPATSVLHVTGGSALGYTWSPSSSIITGISSTTSASPTITALTTGVQVYTVSNLGSYCHTPATQTYTMTVAVCKPGREGSETIDNPEQEDILVAPNPSNGLFSLTLPLGVSSAAVTIADVSGKIVQTKITATDKTDFDISNYPSGLYMITVNTESKKYHAKVLVH